MLTQVCLDEKVQVWWFCELQKQQNGSMITKIGLKICSFINTRRFIESWRYSDDSDHSWTIMKAILTLLPSGTVFRVPNNSTADSVCRLTASNVWHSLLFRTHWRKPVPSLKVMNISALPVKTSRNNYKHRFSQAVRKLIMNHRFSNRSKLEISFISSWFPGINQSVP